MRHRPLGRRDGGPRQPLRLAPDPEDAEPTAPPPSARARAAGAKSQRELDYIAAIEVFYKDHDKVEHRTRAVAYEKAMEQLSARYPDDREAAIFYAIALNATALASDKTYAQQLKAAAILEAVFREQPDHPGAAHYLIHSYDYPPIAEKGLDAARRYATIAPAAPHAQHMPSHIFTRRGYWQDSIRSNLASAAAADNDFDRFHAWDYLAYGYLQLGQDRAARGVLDQILSVEKPNVLNFPVGLRAGGNPVPLRARARPVGGGGQPRAPPG